jgi:hypothetical protein
MDGGKPDGSVLAVVGDRVRSGVSGGNFQRSASASCTERGPLRTRIRHLTKKTATATLILTALATPTTVAQGDAVRPSSAKTGGNTWAWTELFFGADKAGADSKAVVLLCPVDGGDDSSRRIGEIHDKYEKKFQQQLVLRGDSTAQVSL